VGVRGDSIGLYHATLYCLAVDCMGVRGDSIGLYHATLYCLAVAAT
jgi:hypothetical protein